MKITVNGSAGYQFESNYVKAALFDYLADNEYLDIDGVPAENFVKRLGNLRPIFTVDDLISYAVEEGVSLEMALVELENQAEGM